MRQRNSDRQVHGQTLQPDFHNFEGRSLIWIQVATQERYPEETLRAVCTKFLSEHVLIQPEVRTSREIIGIGVNPTNYLKKNLQFRNAVSNAERSQLTYLAQDYPEGKYVDLLVVLVTLHHFRGHPVGIADDGVPLFPLAPSVPSLVPVPPPVVRERRSRILRYYSRQTEICDHDGFVL